MEFRRRGHETLILDLRNLQKENLLLQGVNAAVCFDTLCLRQDVLIKMWDKMNTVVIDILMDPPLRFNPIFAKNIKNHLVFCCDREHVAYMKKYFHKTVPDVYFMPHVGVMPKKEYTFIPYDERNYDVLFCGTYYRPQDKIAEIERHCPKDSDIYHLYRKLLENLMADSDLSIWKGLLYTVEQLGWKISEDTEKEIMCLAESLDWAIRMYQRERVIQVLAESGIHLSLLGRGWENHPSAGLPNVQRIDDRIPYKETLAYMADAKINLNVMPGFKEGTHDRIFNTLLWHSVPLTDSSTWIDENFEDGKNIVLYDLKHLEQLPEIVRSILNDSEKAEKIIENGYNKVWESFTWSHCADWILEAVEEKRSF